MEEGKVRSPKGLKKKKKQTENIAMAYVRWKDLMTEKILGSDAQVASVLLDR